MRLPAHLRKDFQNVYATCFAEQLEADTTDALGFWLVDFLGTLIKIRAAQAGRSLGPGIDSSSNKRDAEEE